MELMFAILIGVLYAAGIFLLLSKSIVNLLFGLVLLGNAANLVIFVCSGVVRGKPPIASENMVTPDVPYSDPLGQALILTAIVISFGVLAFAMVLVKKNYELIKSDDVDMLADDE